MLRQPSNCTRNLFGAQCLLDDELLRFVDAGLRLGNDQPLKSMTEYWHSKQLGINLLSIRSSPYFGKQTFTITDLTSGEPDSNLFKVPDGYVVNDQRKNPRISH